MAFLRNRTINLLNLHSGIISLAVNAGGVFVAVYLLKAGVSVPGVLLTFAAIVAGRFVIRPAVLFFAIRWGLRPLLIIGTTIWSFQYLFVGYVHGIDWPLLGFTVVGAVGDVFYWTSYHAYFAALGDAEHRGHQIGAREAIWAVVGIVAPIFGGWLLVHFGPRVAFAVVMVTQLTAVLPLLGTPNVAVPRTAPGIWRSAARGAALFVADGWTNAFFVTVWQIVMFVSLKESFAAYGGAMAVAALVGAVSSLVLGRYIDLGQGRRATAFSYAAFAAAIVFRAEVHDPTLSVIANAAGTLVGSIYLPAVMTATYNMAKRSPCAFRFQMLAEGGWDVGAAFAWSLAALLASRGTSLSGIIFLALAGVPVSLAMLDRYYVANRIKVELPADAPPDPAHIV